MGRMKAASRPLKAKEKTRRSGRILVRELITDLRRDGWRPVRTRGSHEVWETPTGVRVTIVVNHRSATVSRAVLATVARLRGARPGCTGVINPGSTP